jgi:hypothetical protein
VWKKTFETHHSFDLLDIFFFASSVVARNCGFAILLILALFEILLLPFQGEPHRRGADSFDPLVEFQADLRPARPHGRGQVEHLQPFRFDIDLSQQGLQVLDSFSGVDISFQEMTLSLQSAGHEDPVHSPPEGAQDVRVIELAGAGQPDDGDTGLVGKPHDAGQIRGGKGTVMTGKGDNPRLLVSAFFHLVGPLDLFCTWFVHCSDGLHSRHQTVSSSRASIIPLICPSLKLLT